MIITPEIEETIDSLVERWIPEGKDKFLHVEPRSYMKEMIINLLETNKIPPKLVLVNSLLKNWRPFLYKRFGTLN
jgi:hypothetical protein